MYLMDSRVVYYKYCIIINAFLNISDLKKYVFGIICFELKKSFN